MKKLYIISKSKEEAFGTVAPLHNKSPFELVCLEEDQGKSLMIFNTQQSPQGQKDAFLSLKGSWEASFSVDNHLSPMNSRRVLLTTGTPNQKVYTEHSFSLF